MKKSYIVKRLPCYDDSVLSQPRETMPYDTTTLESANDDLERVIFAPSPLSGFPSNGLQVLVDKKASQEIKEYVQKYLSEVPQSSSPQSIEEGFATIVSRYSQYGSELDSVKLQLVNQVGIGDGSKK
ncbi:MAG: hypothetical protein IJK87_09860 [Prevotella sp.]|nr:hypothetical protein [Prevotella sp.]